MEQPGHRWYDALNAGATRAIDLTAADAELIDE